MTYKEIIASHPDVNKVSVKWVIKNNKVLSEKFEKKFPRSPFNFVVELPYGEGTRLIDNWGDITKKRKVSYLPWQSLKRMGCPQK